MSKVYQFKKYDPTTNKNLVAPRMATRHFIKMARGEIIESTERKIDSSLVNGNGQANIDIKPAA